MGKAELHVEINAELLEEARKRGIHLDAAVEEGLRAALSQHENARSLVRLAKSEFNRLPPEEAAARARQWAEENAEAIKSHRDFIDKYGAFGDDLRTW
jgi:antitoxin CcdA